MGHHGPIIHLFDNDKSFHFCFCLRRKTFCILRLMWGQQARRRQPGSGFDILSSEPRLNISSVQPRYSAGKKEAYFSRRSTKIRSSQSFLDWPMLDEVQKMRPRAPKRLSWVPEAFALFGSPERRHERNLCPRLLREPVQAPSAPGLSQLD